MTTDNLTVDPNINSVAIPIDSHFTDSICSCEICQMLDVMFGDPLLNSWERNFIKSVISYGWISEYTNKQKSVIKRLFRKLKKIRTNA